MAQLHEALSHLSPVKWSDVPIDALAGYLHDAFAQAELIINSVPPIPGGDAFETSRRDRVESSHARATKASEVLRSQARPPVLEPEMQELTKGWGKPVKMSDKDNPLGLSIHKMAGHDRHGAWFARRSVHEGLGFTKWKRAMQKEFPESLAVQAGPGAGSIRGIGGDRKLERHDVEGIGRAEVYELSAKFPPPTSPRDFVTLLLTSDSALGDKSAILTEGGHRIIPRHWLVISIPCEHPDAPPRQGLVRGTYESVEIIREIPLSPPKSQSTPDLLSPSRPDIAGRPRSSTSGEQLKLKAGAEDAESNPVEWIMVTTSDPGGGIPRFLVDRGTPPSIAADAVKFLDWACARDEDRSADTPAGDDFPQTEDDGRRESYSSMNSRIVAGVGSTVRRSSGDAHQHTPSMSHHSASQEQQRSVINQVGSAIGQYTPEVIQQQLPGLFPKEKYESDSGDDSTETSSLDSFASAEPYYTAKTHDGLQDDLRHPRSPDIDQALSSHLSGKSQDSIGTDPTRSQTSLDSNDKELAKIEAKKRYLEQKLAASKEKLEKEEQKTQAKTAEEAERQRARHERDLQKHQERHEKEMRKLDERASKEARKAEARRRKEQEKDASLRMQREIDENRQKAETLEVENKRLREQIGELQRENTMLVAKMGLTEHGQKALKQIRDEIAEDSTLKRRGTSVGSTGSRDSGTVRGRATEKNEIVDG